MCVTYPLYLRSAFVATLSKSWLQRQHCQPAFVCLCRQQCRYTLRPQHRMHRAAASLQWQRLWPESASAKVQFVFLSLLRTQRVDSTSYAYSYVHVAACASAGAAQHIASGLCSSPFVLHLSTSASQHLLSVTRPHSDTCALV